MSAIQHPALWLPCPFEPTSYRQMSQHRLVINYLRDPAQKSPLPIAIEQLLSDDGSWRLIKRNTRNTIAFHSELRVYFKSFNHTNIKEGLKRLFTGGRAQRTLNGTRLLHQAGCQAPDVVAMGHFPGNDFILMESIEGPPLRNALESHLKHQKHPEWRRALFQELGLTIGKMHAKGVIHGDLRGNNVIILPENHHYRLALIDNERTRKPFRFQREQRRNLKQIMLFGPQYITQGEQQLFFSGYFQAFPHPAQAAKQLSAETLREVGKHFKRKGIVQGTPISEANYWPALAECVPYELSRLSNSGERFPQPE
jgi:serine/threonine protein kinase